MKRNMIEDTIILWHMNTYVASPNKTVNFLVKSPGCLVKNGWTRNRPKIPTLMNGWRKELNIQFILKF